MYTNWNPLSRLLVRFILTDTVLYLNMPIPFAAFRLFSCAFLDLTVWSGRSDLRSRNVVSLRLKKLILFGGTRSCLNGMPCKLNMWFAVILKHFFHSLKAFLHSTATISSVYVEYNLLQWRGLGKTVLMNFSKCKLQFQNFISEILHIKK